MKLKSLLFLFVIVFKWHAVISLEWPSMPSLPALTNGLMLKRFIKFYTLQSKSERSDLCARQSKRLYDAVNNGELWAVQMIDASAKIQSGMAKLHITDFGYFDECLQVKHENIAGKYCLATLSAKSNALSDRKANQTDLQKLNLNTRDDLINSIKDTVEMHWAICVPDSCTAKEVEDHLNTFAGVDIYRLDESKCQTLETSRSKLHAGDWIVIVCLAILGVIILLSTIYDIYLFYTKTESSHPIFIAFSWLTNFQKLTNISHNPDMLPCVNGIRFLSMLWIIYAHQYDLSQSTFCANLLDWYYWLRDLSSMLITGSTVAVDSFFLLSGCLLMYGFLKSQQKKIPFNIPLFYLHRYIRLTPAYAATIIFLATLYRFMGSGPLWDPEKNDQPCRTQWWAALLYIQNYVNEKSCVSQSWYLQIDMQLYILAPLILVPIVKWPKSAYYLLGTLLFVSILIPTIIAWKHKLAVFGIDIEDGQIVNKLFNHYYGQTYTRAGPWILGLLLGYILFQTRNKKITLNKITNVALWIISFAVMLFTIFGFHHETNPDYQYEPVFNILFIGLHRVAWSAGLSWIIFACARGYGGPINSFLSLPIFQVLSRLTYSMYLTHIFLLVIRTNSLQFPFLFSNLNMWYLFCGTFMTTVGISLIWTLTFESPFVILDTLLIKWLAGVSQKTTN